MGQWVPYQPEEEVPVAAAKTRQGVVNLDLRERLWIDPDDIVHSGTMHGGTAYIFRTRCGIEVHDASDASLMPVPPVLGCIECILYTGKTR